MPAYKSQPAPAGRNTGKPARSSRPDRQKVKSMNHGQAALTVFSSSGTSDCGRSASLSASSIRCCNSLHPCFNRSSSSALLHFRAVISCKVGISCCSMAICFCCFSIKDGILSSAACGYRADSANPNGRAPDTPQRYFSPLTPSTKKALRSNEPERVYSCKQNPRVHRKW